MSSSESLPNDVALKIASLLTVTDLCSLGSCCRYFRSICDGDELWINLINQRWLSTENLPQQTPNYRYKGVYATRHDEVARRVWSVIQPLSTITETDVKVSAQDYLKIIQDLNSLKLQFQDVLLILFKSSKYNNNNVLINLIGLHYSMFHLGISVNDLREALRFTGNLSKIVCISSFTLGRVFFGVRMPDATLSRMLSLEELMSEEQEESRCILNRGTVEQVFRVETTINWKNEYLHFIQIGS
ncbi:hypothetical protein ZOSMA_16G01290 [Zostera marina]|uniref:F-box domain-containing protein n=1 Tax=Zostera marina TaxID=29655 RepID=A0A0K9PVC1_ZOSMR|nr:hypothetical protein ZOSMA_16G01290 [Zostera marina]